MTALTIILGSGTRATRFRGWRVLRQIQERRQRARLDQCSRAFPLRAAENYRATRRHRYRDVNGAELVVPRSIQRENRGPSQRRGALRVPASTIAYEPETQSSISVGIGYFHPKFERAVPVTTASIRTGT